MTELFRIETIRVDEYRVDILIPAEVATDSPLLIMHDGKSLLVDRSDAWNGQNWGFQDAIQEGRFRVGSVGGGKLPLVAGVHRRNDDDSLRTSELAPQDILEAHPEFWDVLDPEYRPAKFEYTGNQYQDFLALRLVPEIAKRFGLKLARERTAIGGSSLGGFASIYGVIRHPEVFGTAFGVSTHWPLGGDRMVDDLLGRLPEPGHHRIWIDGGTEDLDADYAPHIRYAAKVLTSKGYCEGADFEARVFDGARHCEDDWAKRIDLMVNWWLAGR